jgi:hypothetical protein
VQEEISELEVEIHASTGRLLVGLMRASMQRAAAMTTWTATCPVTAGRQQALEAFLARLAP